VIRFPPGVGMVVPISSTHPWIARHEVIDLNFFQQGN